jgi:conjugative relaxase-like TrwC/TraI family protein
MLTLRAMRNGSGYAARHLEYSDYLDENNKTKGLWMGKAAERLSLAGEVKLADFERLRECEHPDTGEFLRQRRSADRTAADGSKQSEAVNFFDLTFSAPKSVSVLGVLEDSRLLELAHPKAVAEALAEAERLAAVEDQRDDQKQVRQTGNLAVATYQHDTSRELDPQCHTHAVVFNLSHDEATGNWKALHSPTLYERRGYLTEVYRNALAREVMALGYQIESRFDDRGKDESFEIKGVSPELCQKFSKRSTQKEKAIAEFIRNRGREPTDNEVSVLVRNTREDKLREIATAEVRAHQRGQLTPEENRELAAVKSQAATRRASPARTMTAATCLEFAKEHIFERVSVSADHAVLELALQQGRGQVGLEELKTELRGQRATGAVIGTDSQLATKESLERESRMIAAINRGNGKFERLGGEGRTFSSTLPEEYKQQKDALEFILNSRDLAVCLQGVAGAGKTDTLGELARALKEAGREFVAVAPTHTGVKELKERKVANPTTIAALLQDSKAQASLAGKVLIVDEAGMVSGKQMAGLIDLAEKNKAQMILIGDHRQIRSVEACDALRILQKESKLQTTKLTKVHRQYEKAMGGEYRPAVETLWTDRVKGFERIEKMDAVKQVDFLDRPKETVAAFLEAKERLGKEKTVLVVSPTHADIDRYNEALRDHLKASGELQGGVSLDRLEALNWTAAQRKDARRYKPGQVLVFHKDVMGAQKNEFVTVVRAEGGKVIGQKQDGKEVAFTGKQAGAFGVFARRSIELAPGDQIIILANRNERGLKVTTGDVGIISKVDPSGRIHLEDKRVLPANYRQFKHGYAMTAHRSQSKTVDGVIVSADRMEGDLFFVAVSRAREFLRVVTSDLAALRQSVAGDSTRLSATELAKQVKGQERRRERHTAWGRAKLWARQAARAWQQKIFTVEKQSDARTRTDVSPTRNNQAERGGPVPERQR